MHSLRSGWQVFTAEIRKIFAYRMDFWMQYLFSIFAHIGVAYYLWKALFTAQDTTTMQGFTFSGIMFYYLLVPVVGRIIFGGEMGTVSREIYEGSLTKYLIYPVSFFRYKMIQHLAYSCVYTLQMSVAILLFIWLFGVPSDVALQLHYVPFVVISLFFGALLSFVIATTIELIAFWADNVWTLLVMVRFAVGLLGGGMIPRAFFPEAVARALEYSPFPYLTAYPVELIMGKVALDGWFMAMGIALFWIGFFSLTARIVWNRGKYAYTGVGI